MRVERLRRRFSWLFDLDLDLDRDRDRDLDRLMEEELDKNM